MMPMRWTPAVRALVISCVAIFVVQQTIDRFFGGNLLSWLALIPRETVMQFKFWQVGTYLFVHNDVFHVLLNMLMLFFTGVELETLWGTKKFLTYYFFCGVFAGLAYLLLQVLSTNELALGTPMVGASGAIYGLLLAYGMFFGERVLLFMMIFPMKARHFVWVLAGVEFLTGLFSARGSALSSVAHLGGMLGGLLYLRGWALIRAQARQIERQVGSKSAGGKKGKGSHLKLVVGASTKPGPEKDPKDDDKPRTWH